MFGLSAVQQALFVYSELRNTGVFPPLVSQNEVIHKRCIHLVARDYDVEVSIVPSVVCVCLLICCLGVCCWSMYR